MDIEYIKSRVNNFQSCSIQEIEEILNFIADRKRQELGIQFEFDTVYEVGGMVNPEERSEEGYLHVEIGEGALADIKGNKELRERLEEQINTKNPPPKTNEFINIERYNQMIDEQVNELLLNEIEF